MGGDTGVKGQRGPPSPEGRRGQRGTPETSPAHLFSNINIYRFSRLELIH